MNSFRFQFGRLYYLDIGVISGFAAIALGILGFKSRQCDWLPNRNYISGKLYFQITNHPPAFLTPKNPHRPPINNVNQ